MQIELNAPSHLISLSTSSHLVNVAVKTWAATSQNRKISNEVTSAKNADADAGRFTQNLLAKAPEHRALCNHRQTVYNWLQRVTYDWAGDWRILPGFKIEQFKREYDAHVATFDELKQKFFARYPSLVSDAAFRQGDMFDRSLYPDVKELDGRFTMKLFITAVPESDFRSAISEAIADDLRHHYEAQVNSIVHQMVDDVKAQLVSHADRLRNVCTDVRDADDGTVKRKKIYESTVENVRSMVGLLDKFNITNDPELEQARRALQGVMEGVSLEDLRESAAVRAEVKDGLDEVLSMFAPFSSGAFEVSEE
jgi:hypothetical protein